MPPDPPNLRKSMSTIIFLANEKNTQKYYYSPSPLLTQYFSFAPLYENPNETLYIQ